MKKLIQKCLLLVAVFSFCFAAEANNIEKNAVPLNLEQNDDEIFQVVESMPEFPGGMTELMKWLKNNVRYPSICKKIEYKEELLLSLWWTKTVPLMTRQYVMVLTPIWRQKLSA